MKALERIAKGLSEAINLHHKSYQLWMANGFVHHWQVAKARLNLVKAKSSSTLTHQPTEPVPTRGTYHLDPDQKVALAACIFFTLLKYPNSLQTQY